MGIFSYIFKKKRPTIDLLTELEEEINVLEEDKKSNLALEKRIVGSMIIYSVVGYLLSAVVFYVYYYPDASPSQKILFTSPLLLFPFFMIVVKRGLNWFFVGRITRNDDKLKSLRSKKTKMLEEVMENETYKKAKEILERFDPSLLTKMEPTMDGDTGDGISKKSSLPSSPEMEVRHRSAQPLQKQLSGSVPAINQISMTSPSSGATLGQGLSGSLQRLPQQTEARPPNGIPFTPIRCPSFTSKFATPLMVPTLARPILPKERGRLDRVIDMIVGDGPERRFALICSNCAGHNGMALSEEFDFLAFRCCYCHFFNPARKTRPPAPSLERAPSLPFIPRMEGPASQPRASALERQEKRRAMSMATVGGSEPLQRSTGIMGSSTIEENPSSEERGSESDEGGVQMPEFQQSSSS